MYTVKEGSLYMGARKLGDKETIYVDGHQDVAGYVKRSSSKGYSVVQLKEGDYIMVTTSGLTVGIEEKKPSDLSNSIRNRRIQRQLRTLEGMVDIPLLGLRFVNDINQPYGAPDYFAAQWWQLNNLNFSVEMLKWSLRGGIVLLPSHSYDVLTTLKRIRNILQPGQHLLSIVSGSDQKKRVVEANPFRKLVRRLIDGVGPAAAEKLDDYYGGNAKKLLNDDAEGWKDAGLHVGQRGALEELLNGCRTNS